MAKNEKNEMLVIGEVDPIALFEGDTMNPLLAQIEAECAKFVPDLSTGVSRKAIASIANKVAKSKVYLDNLGKDLTEEHRTAVSAVNEVRKSMRERLDVLKESVRLPLTEWETVEAERVENIQSIITEFKEASDPVHALKSAECLSDRLAEIQSIKIDDSFGDLANEASIEKEKCVDRMTVLIEGAQKREADEAELERLRKDAAERDEKERKEREEKERLEREDHIRKDAEADATRRANDESEARIREAQEREEKAVREKQEAEERVERAATAERQRIEREAEEERIAAEKREANKKHCAKINNAAVKAIMKASNITETQAKEVVKAIATGKVPHTSIQY